MAGAAAFKAHGADCVIGFGGGAALDVAKVVGVAATHEGDILEYAWDHPQVRAIERPLPYFVALPTTAGTGSEVGRSSVISEDDTHLKRVIFSPKILARTVFADPELTLGLPPRDHRRHRHGRAHPQHRELPLAGLPPAVRRHRAGGHPHRRPRRCCRRSMSRPTSQARSDMMMASMMGAIAFQKDLGAVHSCAHALGAVCDLHHGLANALMIDTVLDWNQEAACREVRGTGPCVPGLRRRRAVHCLAARTEGPHRHPRQARGAWRQPAQIPRLVEIAVADICHRTNPRPCTAADFERLFEEAM